jgi:predicted nucleotidyltransferase
LAHLRALLRTEPNVSFAALYGSEANGTATPGSDIDLLVALRHDDVIRLADLSGRLSRALERDVQTVRLDDARRTPALLADVLSQGRVLVDRDGTWPRLGREASRVQRDVQDGPSLEDAVAALDLAPVVVRRSR